MQDKNNRRKSKLSSMSFLGALKPKIQKAKKKFAKASERPPLEVNGRLAHG
ncbi:MAG: hypothetical protein AAGG75_12455 [Bacteroidota bacterium]